MASRIVKCILIIVGFVFLIWFAIPLFHNTGWNYGNITGEIVSVILLLYGIFFKKINSFLKSKGKKTQGKIVEIILAVILGIIILTALVVSGFMLSVNYKTPSENLTVIVLGCKVRGENPSLMLTERLNAALDYLNENPDSNVIVSGGMGKDEIVSEASVMKRWLIENGIDEERIVLEDKSTDTHENLENCKSIIDSDGSGKLSTSVGICTNEFHEYRALSIAKENGLNASSIKADTAWWLLPTYWVREIYGVLEDWFLQ